ncbi:unnamed protein product [Fusarium graminearum]|nr:unnamed protein product [Fusarium graminearum]
MTYGLDTHILTVDVNFVCKIGTSNPTDWYRLWTVFSRSADFVEQGRRLENLSWRLWQRETFVVDNEKTAPTAETLPRTIRSDSMISDLSQLSHSVDSIVNEGDIDFSPVSAPLEIARPRVRRQDSCASTRSKREHHISSDDFQKMIVSIVKDKGPLSAPPHVAPVAKESLHVPPAFERSDSTTVESHSPAKSTASEGSPQPSPQSLSRTTVLRGFSPSQIPTPQTISGAQSSDAIPQSQSSPGAKVVQSKKPACFALGGFCSSSEQDQSLSNGKPAVVDSDSDYYIDESAIDDDGDSSDWEDSMEESDKSRMDDRFFQRVDYKPNFTSRRSLISLMLAEGGRTRNLGDRASQSTSTIRLSYKKATSGKKRTPSRAPKSIPRVPRSTAQPIMPGPNHLQPEAALSPRTTRRNMLATELSESLRRHLLWERQQKSSTANAVLKRRHTSHDVANLRQFPEKPCMKQSEHMNASSWNQYFSKEASDGYHSKGW